VVEELRLLLGQHEYPPGPVREAFEHAPSLPRCRPGAARDPTRLSLAAGTVAS
jgi:hypothetical protein